MRTVLALEITALLSISELRYTSNLCAMLKALDMVSFRLENRRRLLEGMASRPTKPAGRRNTCQQDGLFERNRNDENCRGIDGL